MFAFFCAPLYIIIISSAYKLLVFSLAPRQLNKGNRLSPWQHGMRRLR